MTFFVRARSIRRRTGGACQRGADIHDGVAVSVYNERRGGRPLVQQRHGGTHPTPLFVRVCVCAWARGQGVQVSMRVHSHSYELYTCIPCSDSPFSGGCCVWRPQLWATVRASRPNLSFIAVTTLSCDMCLPNCQDSLSRLCVCTEQPNLWPVCSAKRVGPRRQDLES